MGKKRTKNSHKPSGAANASYPEDPLPLLNGTTVSLGAILAVLVGIFLCQLEGLYSLYLGALGNSPAPPGRWDSRGVARIDIGAGLEVAVELFVNRNEPFVCRSCLPSTHFWDDDSNLLQAVGSDSFLKIRVAERASRNGDGNLTVFRRAVPPGSRGKESAYPERNMSFAQFLGSYAKPDTAEHLYAAQVNVMSALPGLLPHVQTTAPPIELLEAVGPAPPVSHRPLSMYLGKGPLATQTHYDSLENIVCVVSGGHKTFNLYDPATSSLLLYVDRTKYGNGSPVPPDLKASEDDSNLFPLSKFALPSTVQLSSGDCLYLPVYWYHTVTSSAHRTVSINWWRMPNHDKMVTLERLFCGHDDSGARAKCR